LKSLIRAIESYLGRFLLWVTAVLLVALLYAEKTATPGQWGAGDWEAFGTVVTAMIALAAAAVAIVQLKDARDVRWEQALPYVAAYLDPDPTDPKLIYLTIKNFGATIAENLELEITPDAARSSGVGGGTLNLPQTMPALVPGQEWRTFWDFSVYRHQEQMLKRHTLVIAYADSRGTRHSMESVLDWESYTLGRRWIGRKSIHHVGESVAKIEKSIGKLAKTAAGRGGPSHGDPAGLFGTAPATSLPADAEVLARLGIDTETETLPEVGTGEEAVAPAAEDPRETDPQTGTDLGDDEAQPNET
jgi:hypothetical protein